MLEVLRTLMLKSKLSLKGIESNESQAISWYKSVGSSVQNEKMATIDLLQKTYELFTIKTEAIKDQLIDVFNSFKQFVEAKNVDFVHVETVRRIQFDKLGGFNKGVYLEGVTVRKDYSNLI